MTTADSTNQCVVVLGSASLQQYILQSNRLKEILGASFLAKDCFDQSLIEIAMDIGHNDAADAWKCYEHEKIRPVSPPEIPQEVKVHLMYVGGGNAALLCGSRKIANEVVNKWSRKLLAKAPGLRVVVGYGDVTDGDVTDSLARAYKDALDDLVRCEEALPFGSPLHSLPVVRSCTSTGFPASKGQQEKRGNSNVTVWISQSAARKRDEVGFKDKKGRAQKAISEEFYSILKADRARKLPRHEFAIDFDDLGGYEGQSHVAVVHADGNGMGRLLNEVINTAISESHDDVTFLHNLRTFSASVTELSREALKNTMYHLRKALPLRALHTSTGIFPIRPIVYGGDDLTFVCDGRLGLDLAAFYLEQFAQRKIPVCGGRRDVDACAGIAIVPSKFPFARAYRFAEELCGMAKDHRRNERDRSGSWLDFQIFQAGVTMSISALRDLRYHNVDGETLHQRPYRVPGNWEDFAAITKSFQSSNWPRSHAKRLLQALVQGLTATKSVVEGAGWRDIEMPSTAITDRECFDAIETLDFYIELKDRRENAPLTAAGNLEEGDEG